MKVSSDSWEVREIVFFFFCEYGETKLYIYSLPGIIKCMMMKFIVLVLCLFATIEAKGKGKGGGGCSKKGKNLCLTQKRRSKSAVL